MVSLMAAQVLEILEERKREDFEKFTLSLNDDVLEECRPIPQRQLEDKTVAGMVSLWSQAVIAFERYLVICKLVGNFAFWGPQAVAGCALTWVVALSAACPPLLSWSRYIPEGLQCSCGPDWYTIGNKYNNESYVIFLFCFCFTVPFTTIVFCYSQLLFTLKSAAKAQEQSASTQKAEREVTKMVVVMVLGLLVCWLPYASFALWAVLNRGNSFDLRLATIPSCFSKASTSMSS
ncbi:hypothetical protein SKAU_G00153150 [Synaphobranchus kaupii]|uniref:G-protein coupled receptors family 1 profile domain-containing protein n=1 Tax=Synaphobranchus kaupii TaxID=118154 RepID=A0A9Q1FHL1_SYNKA|nr:hypothetical protein SKAU_G00153150 [Synaphobranchus kaupii]